MFAERLQDASSSEAVNPTADSCPPIAVAGVAGYAGGELARLLLRHPRIGSEHVSFFGRASESGADTATPLSELHPQLHVGDNICARPFSWTRLEEAGTQVLFLATPHEQSRDWVPEALKRGIRVVDLSGAWRLRQPANRRVYQLRDANPGLSEGLQREAVYGSPELHKDAIVSARLVANPGCYATSLILALSPLLREGLVDLERGILCDSKSGVSGAGKSPTPGTHFMYAADNLSAYAVFGHRHTGELLEQLHLSESQIQFTPHLLPIPRGILSSIYLRLSKACTGEALVSQLRAFYHGCPFVRVRSAGTLPQIQHVAGTNFCDLGVAVDEAHRRIVLISCLDNLLKGAAGQAVQNMNLMMGWGETEGLL